MRRRKFPLTASARDRRSMWCPVSVQLLRANTNCTPDHVDSFCLRPHGTPVVREMLELSSWRIIRGGVLLWKHGPGSVAGTLTCSAPDRTSQRVWDVAAADTPAVVVLERLVMDGWRVGTPPPRHTATSARIFRKPVKTEQKAYWQCLAISDMLFFCEWVASFVPRYANEVLRRIVGITSCRPCSATCRRACERGVSRLGSVST